MTLQEMVNKIESEKYPEEQGYDRRVAGYNEGLDFALSLICEITGLKPEVENAVHTTG
jgi:hypothetical protein